MNSDQSRMNRSKALLANALIGLPGGALIFMGMLMFNALLGKLSISGGWVMLLILSLCALITGLLARWMRPFNGFGAALVSGVVAALIILFLWLSAAPGSGETLVFGPLGMLAAVGFSALGGWVLPHLRKSKKR